MTLSDTNTKAALLEDSVSARQNMSDPGQVKQRRVHIQSLIITGLLVTVGLCLEKLYFMSAPSSWSWIYTVLQVAPLQSEVLCT